MKLILLLTFLFTACLQDPPEPTQVREAEEWPAYRDGYDFITDRIYFRLKFKQTVLDSLEESVGGDEVVVMILDLSECLD
jgi:hypothetical protein